MSEAKLEWRGVMPATTTEFLPDGQVDEAFLARHAQWLVDAGCSAIVCHGSLGEGASLSFAEKSSIQRCYVAAVGSQVPIVAGIAAATTDDAVRLAKEAEVNGCKGLMVLPPYLYSSSWHEMRAHMVAVMQATTLPCVIYNNPVAYRTDFLPEHMAELAQSCPNAQAVKESSTDVRRIAAIRELCGDRLTLGVGVDDCALEGAVMGAKFWIAGVVNGLPVESVLLWNLAQQGEVERAMRLYQWLLPLLRMDTVVTFVQKIKMIQKAVGWGSERVRAPRLPLVGSEREQTLREISVAMSQRDSVLEQYGIKPVAQS